MDAGFLPNRGLGDRNTQKVSEGLCTAPKCHTIARFPCGLDKRMFWRMRKRSFLASFGLTGVLLVLVLLNLTKHPVDHRVPSSAEIPTNYENPGQSSGQNRDGRSLMNISSEEARIQKQDAEGEEPKGQDTAKEETASSIKEAEVTSPAEHSKPTEIITLPNPEVQRISEDSRKSVNNPQNNGDRMKTRIESVNRDFPQKTPPRKLPPRHKKTPNSLVDSLNKPYTNQTIEKILKILSQRMKKYYAREHLDIDFTPGELIPANKTRKILLASTWRSGSSFLGQILSSYPATFYSYEPLHIYLKNQYLEDGPDVPKVIKLLTDISTCNFAPHNDFLEYMKNLTFLMSNNKIAWSSCAYNRAVCFDPHFLSQLCQYMPLNVMKTVRLGLAPIEQLLNDPTLDMRVVYLIRDPRGSLHSRMQLEWCISKKCSDPKTVCDNFLLDFRLAEEYAKKYPDKFLLIRYEDLSLEPERVTQDILRLAGVSYHRNIKRFLGSHTKLEPKKSNRRLVGPYTTFRDSKTTAFAWRDALSFETIDKIQKPCEELLHKLGYTYFRTAEDCLNKNISALT